MQLYKLLKCCNQESMYKGQDALNVDSCFRAVAISIKTSTRSLQLNIYARESIDSIGPGTPCTSLVRARQFHEKMVKEAHRLHPLAALENRSIEYLKIGAPMVRYSKLPFREIIRKYNVDLAFTPMILADVFKQSQFAQEIEFQTHLADDPVIVQFAASNALDLASAAEIVAPYCNGIDINCGCPQKWAISEGIGSHLLSDPELVRDMIRQTKARTNGIQMTGHSHLQSFPVSVKMRLLHPTDVKKTIEFAQRAEAAGADFITLHARTNKQKSSEPVDLEAIRLLKEHLSIPCFANGDIFTLSDADFVVEKTGVDGVMAARGLLENPALFSGYESTPISAVQHYIDAALSYGTDQFIFHQHLIMMLEHSMTRTEKKLFLALSGIPSILDYLETHYRITPCLPSA